MTRRTDTGPNIKILPMLAVLVVLCLVAAAALTALTLGSAPVAAPAEQLSLVAAAHAVRGAKRLARRIQRIRCP